MGRGSNQRGSKQHTFCVKCGALYFGRRFPECPHCKSNMIEYHSNDWVNLHQQVYRKNPDALFGYLWRAW